MSRKAFVIALLAALCGGCASTHHYYTGTGYQNYRVGNSTVYGSVRVSASAYGVTVSPTVRYVPPPKSRAR